MKVFISILIITLLVSFELSANLLVYPTKVELDNRNRSAVFSIVNKNNKESRYEIYFEDKYMLPTGDYVTVDKDKDIDKGKTSLVDFARYSPRRVNLQPEQAANVRLALRLPKNIKKGEYRSYIVFHEIPPPPVEKSKEDNAKFSIAITAYTKIAIPVILRVGDLTSELKIENDGFDAEKRSMQVTLTRTGDRSTYGNIEILNALTLDVIGKSKNLSIYTELDTRTFDVPLTVDVLPNTDLIVRYTENETLNDAKTIDLKIKFN